MKKQSFTTCVEIGSNISKSIFKPAIIRGALILTAALAFQSIAQAATVSILPSPPGDKRSAFVNQPGYTTENFDAFVIRQMTNGETGTSAIGNWQATGADNNVYDGSASPLGDGKFVGIETNSSITFTLNTPSRYIGFYSLWVSGGNTWRFYDSSDNLIATLDSSSMVSLVGTKAQNKPVVASDGQTYPGSNYYTAFTTGQTEPSFYVNLQLDDPSLYFSKVVFSNGPGGGNEFDNITISANYISGNNVVPPGPPTGVSASAGHGNALVVFTAPASDGGAPIISYTAICTSSDGGVTGSVSGATSPLEVTGLTNGKTYTCTVAATNSAGMGSESSASTSITPQAPTPAPIPTLSQWAMMFLASLMAMFAIRRMRLN